jgi:hypothetical protein
MIHSSNYKPRIFPVLIDSSDVEIDRVQDLSSTATLNRTKIQEVGRDGIVSWRQSTPTITVNVRQFEYGQLEFFKKLANKGDSVTQINTDDFSTSTFDIAGYMTDDNATFLGTIYYPSLRLSGFGVNIGDPDAIIERTFTCVGEDDIALINSNKYLIHGRYTIASSGNDKTVTLSNPVPTLDPDNSGQYLFKVVKVSAGVATELDHGTDWSCNGTVLTINGASLVGDVIWVTYSASTQGGQTTFVNNDTDVGCITADSASIYLTTSTYVYRLQSVGIDVTFDRRDIKEIGNKEVVSRGIRDTTCRITLGKILENYTIEEYLRGVTGQSYGKIDIRKFTDDNKLIVKLYADNTKKTFKMGYEFSSLAPSGKDAGNPVNDYITAGITLEGDTGFITNVEGVLV